MQTKILTTTTVPPGGYWEFIHTPAHSAPSGHCHCIYTLWKIANNRWFVTERYIPSSFAVPHMKVDFTCETHTDRDHQGLNVSARLTRIYSDSRALEMSSGWVSQLKERPWRCSGPHLQLRWLVPNRCPCCSLSPEMFARGFFSSLRLEPTTRPGISHVRVHAGRWKRTLRQSYISPWFCLDK